MQKGIRVNEETYELLKGLRRPGQSFEGVIVELMSEMENNNKRRQNE